MMNERPASPNSFWRATRSIASTTSRGRAANDHTFTRSQTVGLHNQRCAILWIGITILDKTNRIFGATEYLIISGRHIGLSQQVLAEHFAAFQLCCRLAWLGPNTRKPSLRMASLSPAANGASGPMTVKPISFCLANLTSSGTLVAEIGTFVASSAVPALPGATKISLTRGLRPNSTPTHARGRHYQQSKSS